MNEKTLLDDFEMLRRYSSRKNGASVLGRVAEIDKEAERLVMHDFYVVDFRNESGRGKHHYVKIDAVADSFPMVLNPCFGIPDVGDFVGTACRIEPHYFLAKRRGFPVYPTKFVIEEISTHCSVAGHRLPPDLAELARSQKPPQKRSRVVPLFRDASH